MGRDSGRFRPMANHVIRNGLDLPIAGGASGDPVRLPDPTTVALDPREIRGFIPRMAARAGDRVKRGSPVLYHKLHPEVRVVAPVSGVLEEVRRGQRRVITELVFRPDGDEVEAQKTWSVDALKGIDAAAAVEQLKAGGAWPLLRTRPLDQMPDPDKSPQSVVICATETGPLQPGPAALLADGDQPALQAAVHVFRSLCDKVFLTSSGANLGALKVEGAEHHTFTGPHPSGDPGVQVNLLDPPRGANQVWYIRAWDAVLIGRMFLEGVLPNERVYAAVGAGVKQPRLVRTLVGAPLADVVGDVAEGENRWIRGSVLTGESVDPGAWAGFFHRAVHVLPEKVDTYFMGWALPQPSRWSVHRAFLTAFTKASKPYDLRPGLWGGRRAIVHDAWYDKVIATPDIAAAFLFRSIIAGDLEESIQLGLLDITEEEAALCSYICPSKVDFAVVLREGLDLYLREA